MAEAELGSFFGACQMRNGYLAPRAIIKAAREKDEASAAAATKGRVSVPLQWMAGGEDARGTRTLHMRRDAEL